MPPQDINIRCTLAILAAALGAEWLLPAAPRLIVATPATHAVVREATSGSPKRAARFAATALDRPLFSKDRRPPQQASQADASAARLPRLSGIMIAGRLRRAIFEDGRTPMVTAVGDRMGVFRILAIAPADVTVEGPDGTREVALAFDADRPVSPPMPASGLLDQFRNQPRRFVPVPRPPTVEQMMSRLRPQSG
jgi:hypothetical protein